MNILDYEQGAADERARIVWWLRAGLSGPAKMDSLSRQAVTALADVIEEHPERFACAPPARPEASLGSPAPPQG